MTGKVVLVGSNKCPICGTEFLATPPLRPNVADREFYGGRVNFFKEVDCKCEAKYDLCIERKFTNGEDRLNVINMVVLKEGRPLREIEEEKHRAFLERANQKAIEAIEEAKEKNEKLPTLKERQQIKRDMVLATIIDKDAKIDTLTHMTTDELRKMCKVRKIKYLTKDNKTTLAEKLLEKDPSLVVARENT